MKTQTKYHQNYRQRYQNPSEEEKKYGCERLRIFQKMKSKG